MAEKKKKPPTPGVHPMAIEWRVGNEIVPCYTTNLVVQCGELECTISFFHVKLPILLGTPEENAEKLREMKGIRADCVSQVIVPLQKLPEFIEAIKASYDKRMNLERPKHTNGESDV